jgi:hypothetical protein
VAPVERVPTYSVVPLLETERRLEKVEEESAKRMGKVSLSQLCGVF